MRLITIPTFGLCCLFLQQMVIYLFIPSGNRYFLTHSFIHPLKQHLLINQFFLSFLPQTFTILASWLPWSGGKWVTTEVCIFMYLYMGPCRLKSSASTRESDLAGRRGNETAILRWEEGGARGLESRISAFLAGGMACAKTVKYKEHVPFVSGTERN